MRPLDTMGLSQAQLAAVLDPSPQVLVAAGAGSGKTRLLVAAVVQALTVDGLPADRLVAVTFTRKAGGELTARVRAALEGCGRPDLARSLDSAALGTIDALCRRLVKDHALEAGVDPNFTVLEPEAAEMVKEEVMRRAWEEVVQGADETVLGAVASQGEGLRKDALLLYERLRGLGHDDPRVVVDGGQDEDEVRPRLVAVIEQALAAGESQARLSASSQADLLKLQDCLVWLRGPVAARSGDAGLVASASFFPSRRSHGLEDSFAPVRAELTRYRCVLAEASLRPLVEAVNVLLAEFHRRYTERKQEQGLADFADLELKTRALVACDGHAAQATGLFPGALLLVDEFQDTNELQCAILSKLGAARVVMVGDERQSIYRFRGAEVEVFRRRKKELAARASEGLAKGLHQLDVNYRSSPELLAFINRLFAHRSLFGEDFVPLTMHPDRKAVERRLGHAAAAVHPCVEVLVAGRRYEGDEKHLVPAQQAEAEALAAHLRGLVDREGWRQRDMVVLLPTQTRVDLYRDALVAQGLDVYLVRGKGYYAQEEVTDVVALLRLLVNPHDDLALIVVLRSPLTGLSDDGLYALGKQRRELRARSLWEVIRSGEVENLDPVDRVALASLLERLAALRQRVGRPGLPRLIDEAMSVFGYDVCLLRAQDGRRRFANVRKLMRLAEEFERISGPDLAGLTAVLDSRGRVSDREGSAPTLAEGEDVVRVMTVHQAKGLEFPVVVVAGLGADFHRPETCAFAIGSDGRAGVFLKGHRQQTYEAYDPCWGPAAEIAAEEVEKEREEDVRLLYVAMTRAQERLVLVGARPDKDATEGSRIGRVLEALGLTTFPKGGETVSLEGLSAVVAGVEPLPATFPPEATSSEAAGPEAIGGHEGGPTGLVEAKGPPRLLELSRRAGVPRRVSFSALAAYERCPRRFYLERMLGLTLGAARLGEEEGADESRRLVLDEDEESAGLDVGILVHRLLEELPLDVGRPAVGCLRESAEEAAVAAGLQLSPPDLERAIRLTLAAWDAPWAERLAHSPVEREAPFFFAHGDTVVSGVMDLVWQDPDRWHVVDYKTNALKGRSVEELAKDYALQGQVYCLAALRAGAPAAQMDLLFLERPCEPVTLLCDAKDMECLEGRLNAALAGLRAHDFSARLGNACAGCGPKAACRSMAPA